MIRHQPEEKPLQSWKEIAAYLERDERTAMRWEKEEGLPIRRHRSGGRGSVYAYPSEIEAWRAERVPQAETPNHGFRAKRLIPALAAAACLALAAWFVLDGPILNPPGPRAEASSPVGMTARLVSNDPVSFRGSPFPDGRSISCVEWLENSGELATCNLESGQIRRLTSYENTGNFAYYSVVSPDGSKIAYSFFENGSYDLRVAAADKPDRLDEDRILVDDSTYIEPFAWSPDGAFLVAVQVQGGVNRICLVWVESGELTVLKTLDWRWPEFVSISPDGRWVAYDVPVRDDSPDRDIFVIAADGSRETALVQRRGLDYGPAWAPDGSVLFASDRAGSIGLWAIGTQDGRPKGKPRVVKPAVGRIRPVGMTSSGQYFYGLQSESEDIYVAEMAPDAGRVLEPPKLASDQFVGTNMSPVWSPDGKRLAFFSRRHLVSFSPTPATMTLVVRDFETGEESRIPTELSIIAPGRWIPGTNEILLPVMDRKRRWSVQKVDTATGTSEDLTGPLPGNVARFSRPAISPDGKTAYFLSRTSADNTEEPASNYLIAMDLESLKTRELMCREPPEQIRSIAVSPDGRSLALLVVTETRAKWRVKRTVFVMDLSAGASRLIHQNDEAATPMFMDHGLEFTADGDYLLTPVALNPDDDGLSKTGKDILRISLDGSPAMTLGLQGFKQFLRFPTLHPDGRHIAFDTSATGELGRELWVLENFLPQPATDD